MTTPDKPNQPSKRITIASKINDYRPKLMATLTPDGVIAWNKYDKCPQLIKREEIEAFWATCKALIEQCPEDRGPDAES